MTATVVKKIQSFFRALREMKVPQIAWALVGRVHLNLSAAALLRK